MRVAGSGGRRRCCSPREGAAVVVNDLGGEATGEGADQRPAQQVVDEIVAAGGRAVANYDNIASWDGGQALIAQAVDELGGLDVLINNAGILRDKMSFNMTEEEWDSVIDVHLKGHFVDEPLRGRVLARSRARTPASRSTPRS